MARSNLSVHHFSPLRTALSSNISLFLSTHPSRRCPRRCASCIGFERLTQPTLFSRSTPVPGPASSCAWRLGASSGSSLWSRSGQLCRSRAVHHHHHHHASHLSRPSRGSYRQLCRSVAREVLCPETLLWRRMGTHGIGLPAGLLSRRSDAPDHWKFPQYQSSPDSIAYSLFCKSLAIFWQWRTKRNIDCASARRRDTVEATDPAPSTPRQPSTQNGGACDNNVK